MLHFVNLFVISFLFAHAGKHKVGAFSCNPKKFDW